MASLYERLGGRQALHTLIDLFYYKVLLDGELKKKFEGTNIMSLKEHQLEFMTCIFGGGKTYPLERLRQVHAHLHITDTQFQATCRHLREAMEEMSLQPELIAEVMAIITRMHDDIVIK